MNNAALYFHYPCFDGLVSCVLAWEFLEKQKGWNVTEFLPVTYTVRSTWLSNPLKAPCAIVDFLYHPNADFWADHHATSMLTQEVAADYHRRKECFPLYFDPKAGSCASLLYRHVGRGLLDKPHFQEMVEWAEKIDSARYASVEEAILGEAPALKINRSILLEPGADYARFLCKELREHSLEYVAELDEVRTRQNEVERRTRAGLKKLGERECGERKWVKMEPGGVVKFEAELKGDEIINRYSGFHFEPDARYSLAVIRSEDGTAITAMRNPWREFPSVPLGRIFEKKQGGGHQRVGSVFISKNDSQNPDDVVEFVLSQLSSASPEVNV